MDVWSAQSSLEHFIGAFELTNQYEVPDFSL